MPISPIYVHNENKNQSTVQTKTVLGLLPFNPVPGISVHLVHQIGTGHFGKKLLSPLLLFCVLLTRTKTKREVVWFGAMQQKCTVPLGTWNVRTFKLLNCSALVLPYVALQRTQTPPPYTLCTDAYFIFDEEGRGAVCTHVTALTILKKGIKGL